MRALLLAAALLPFAADPGSAQDFASDILDLHYFRAFATISVGRAFAATTFVDGIDLAAGAEAYNANLGVDLGRYLSFEFDAAYVEFDVTTRSLGKVGELTLATFVPQLRFRAPLRDGRLIPWVAGGVGGGTLTVNDRTLAGVDVFAGPLEYVMAFAADAGVEYFVAPNLGLTAQFQYKRAARDITLPAQMRVVRGVVDAASTSFGLRLYIPRSAPERLFPDVVWSRPTGLRDGLYFSLAMGLRAYRQKTVTSDAILKSTGGSEQTTTVAIGAALNRHLALEITGLFHEIPIWTSQKLVEFSTWLVAPQLRVLVPGIFGPFVPHLMGGAGLGLGETNDPQPVNSFDPGGGFRGKTTSFAATAGVGLSVPVFSNVQLLFDYHYLHHRSTVVRGDTPISIDMSATQMEWGIRLFFR